MEYVIIAQVKANSALHVVYLSTLHAFHLQNYIKTVKRV
jgi:hypothetical protein